MSTLGKTVSRVVLAEVGCSRHVDTGGALAMAFRRRPDVGRALLECSRRYAAAAARKGWMVAPVGARQEILGHLWALASEGSGPDAGFLRTGLEQAARVVPLEMLRERAVLETERRLRRDFVASLLGVGRIVGWSSWWRQSETALRACAQQSINPGRRTPDERAARPLGVRLPDPRC